MIRRLLIRKRIQRLEAVEAKQAHTELRDALIEMLSGWEGERHLAMVSPPGAGRCIFQERPGPGPQLADFGEFSWVLRLSTAEINF
jgi:hypothetical protein